MEPMLHAELARERVEDLIRRGEAARRAVRRRRGLRRPEPRPETTER